MKKILLGFCLFFTLSSYAQSTYYIYAVQLGKFNEYTQKWKWDATETLDQQFTITLNKNVVSIDNKNLTTLFTYEDLGEKYGTDEEGDRYRVHAWMAYDQEKRKCKFSMLWYTNLSLEVYTVMYSDYGFRYYIKKD